MKTIIVTGANSGLGLWTTRYLLDQYDQVILACRNVEKAKQVMADFPGNRGKNYIIKPLDLGDFDSIKSFVIGLSEFKEIYGLDCNAGMSYEGPFRYTKNGIEETFGTNFLGHFLMTNLLLQRYHLEKIVIISSELHNPNNKSPFAKAEFKPIEELAHPQIDPHTTLEKQGQSFYSTSKLCDILFAYELDRRLNPKGLPPRTLVNVMNPGLMLSTNLARTHKPWENIYRKGLHLMFKLIGLADTPQGSAKYVVRLLHEVTTSGVYYDRGTPARSSDDSYDIAKAKLLWEGGEQLVGMKFLNEYI